MRAGAGGFTAAVERARDPIVTIHWRPRTAGAAHTGFDSVTADSIVAFTIDGTTGRDGVGERSGRDATVDRRVRGSAPSGAGVTPLSATRGSSEDGA